MRRQAKLLRRPGKKGSPEELLDKFFQIMHDGNPSFREAVSKTANTLKVRRLIENNSKQANKLA